MKAAIQPTAQDKALDLFADMMIQKIETIAADWRKPWFTLTSQNAYPQSFEGRAYNGGNAFMLLLLCEKEQYLHPIFATFNKIQKLNEDTPDQPRIMIKKGAKSFPVLLTNFYYYVGDQKVDEQTYINAKAGGDDDATKIPFTKVYNVFNVAQTNMETARPELFAKLTSKFQVSGTMPDGNGFHLHAVDMMIQNQGWHCPINLVKGNRAFYNSGEDQVTLPLYEQFYQGESFYSTLFHELSHSTGHKSRLDRFKPDAFGGKDYAREELVAEMSAALTAQYYGITRTIDENSVPYLQGWLKNLKQDSKYIKTVLTDVRKASSMITKAIEAA